MAEVSKQLKPIHDWMLGFWSNGSGRPPGYFQMRVKADDERYERLAKEAATQSKALNVMADFIKTSQTRQREAEERQREREERIRFWMPIAKWVLGGIASLLLGLAIWAYHAVAPVVGVLWHDYLQTHPMVVQQLRHEPSENRLPMDAKENLSVLGIVCNGVPSVVPAALQNVPASACNWTPGVYAQVQLGSMPNGHLWQLKVSRLQYQWE